MWLYSFARAAVAVPQTGGLNNRSLSSHGSGGQKSEMKGAAGLVPSEAEGASAPGLAPTLALQKVR